jgi:hypothetical protein
MMYIEIVTEGIRTLACFHTPLAGVRHQPLGHRDSYMSHRHFISIYCSIVFALDLTNF